MKLPESAIAKDEVVHGRKHALVFAAVLFFIAACGGGALADPIPVTVTIDAITEGTATTVTAANHASNYDGPTQFTMTYTIAFNPNGTPDLAHSSVFTQTINYTSANERTHLTHLERANFKTLTIPITGSRLTMTARSLGSHLQAQTGIRARLPAAL